MSCVWLLLVSGPLLAATDADVEARVSALLGKMTLAEKIGQMSQINGADGKLPDGLRETIRRGRIGSILNEVDLGIDLGTGGASQATIWTCDLSAEYIRINADYRT